MSDLDRYTSLIKRQKAKLVYARKLAPKFARCVDQLGPAPSMNEVAQWLNRRRVKPGAKAKPGSKWVAQTVLDYLHLDGIEPTDAAVRMEPTRREGFRVTARREFWKAEATMRLVRGDERVEFEARQLDTHIAEVEKVASLLRSALRLSAPY